MVLCAWSRIRSNWLSMLEDLHAHILGGTSHSLWIARASNKHARMCSFALPARSEARQTDAVSDLFKGHAHRQIYVQFLRSNVHDATQHAWPLLQLHQRNVIGR